MDHLHRGHKGDHTVQHVPGKQAAPLLHEHGAKALSARLHAVIHGLEHRLLVPFSSGR